MTALKCPNPSCPFLFDPSQVPPGSVLACPRCGMRFTLGAPPAAPPPGMPAESATMTLGAAPPGYPGQPTATFPGAQTPAGNATLTYGAPHAGYPGQPPAPAGYGPPPGYAAPPGYGAPPGYAPPPSQLPTATAEPPAPPPTAPPRYVGRKAPRSIATVILATAVALVVSGGALGLIVYGLFGGAKRNVGGTRFDELNLVFDPPDKKAGWARNENLEGQYAMFRAYTRSDADGEKANIVFGGRDFKNRDPRPAEIEDAVQAAMKGLFANHQREEFPGAKWLGQPAAVAFTFRASAKDEAQKFAGECVAVAHKGVAYWTVAWAGENEFDAERPAFADARGRFRFNTLRDSWSPTVPTTRPFRGQTAGYKILDADGVWDYPKKGTEPTDADLHLLYELKRRKADDARKYAELEVYVVEGAGDGGDPLDQAVAEVEKRRNPDPAVFGRTTLEELTDEVRGEPTANPVEGKTPVRRFRTKTFPVGSQVEDKNRAALVVVSGIKVEDKLIVLQAWCPEWNNRDLFEPAVAKIAATLQPAK